MTYKDFLQRCVSELRSALPEHLQGFSTRYQTSLVKLYYGDPAIHYELWLRGNGIMEIGLHFEADKATNDGLLRYMSDRALDIVSQLGPQVEIEQWTKSWGRVHQTMPFTLLTDNMVSVAVQRMAAMIQVLQPILEEA